MCEYRFFRSRKIDFLKIDVENMEMEVLKWCQNSIDTFKPPIIIEVSSDNVSAMVKWMKENKYRRTGQKVFRKNTWLLEKI